MITRTVFSAIGLDMLPDRVRLLQLKCQGELLSIHEAAQAEVKGKGKEGMGLLDALRKVLSGRKLKGNHVMAALPGHMVTTIPIRFSLKEGEGIEQAILREAHNYLSFPLEKGVIDYLNLPLSDQRSSKAALLIASKREDIVNCLDLFKQAGLDASVIEPRYCSLFRTIQWARQGEPLKDQFIFSMEENLTMLMVIVDEQILVVREVAWGVNTIREKVGKALGLSGKKVDRILQQYGVDPGNPQDFSQEKAASFLLDDRELRQVISEVLSPILEDLCQEIQKVLSYCVSLVQQRVIDRALLLGEGARIRFLDRFVQQRTGIQVSTWPGVSILNELAEVPAFFEVALGLTLRGMKNRLPGRPAACPGGA
ncbi:MAG: pilus assembly protein PilM [bacterium]